MKKLILFIFIVFAINVKSQIVFEHRYDSAATGGNISGNNAGAQLMVIKFEVSGEQYVNINKYGKYISIYNMNHSFVKNISYASFPQPASASILYLSEQLFNTDPAIEFMYCSADISGNGTTSIYKEDGTLLFYADSAYPLITVNVPDQQYPIYNTSVGTKMILSYKDGHANVFSLAGTLTTAIDRANTQLVGNGAMLANPRPNPTANTTTIDYTLPQNTNQAELVFYNTQGTEVKRFKVDNTFSSLLISTTDIAAGTYYYSLQIAGNPSAAKKMVVVK
jgi:hypothetical protein